MCVLYKELPYFNKRSRYGILKAKSPKEFDSITTWYSGHTKFDYKK